MIPAGRTSGDNDISVATTFRGCCFSKSDSSAARAAVYSGAGINWRTSRRQAVVLAFLDSSWIARTTIACFSTCPGEANRHQRFSSSLCSKLHFVTSSLFFSAGSASPVMFSTKCFTADSPPEASGFSIFYCNYICGRTATKLFVSGSHYS